MFNFYKISVLLSSAGSGVFNCRGNLSTYKELCSLASDLNQPDLIYKFMHLANHHSLWNSKKVGVATGHVTSVVWCDKDVVPAICTHTLCTLRVQRLASPPLRLKHRSSWPPTSLPLSLGSTATSTTRSLASSWPWVAYGPHWCPTARKPWVMPIYIHAR